MKDSLNRLWRWVRWPLAVLVVAYAVLVVYRTGYLFEKDRVDADVAGIHAQRLVLADVEGAHLPPDPSVQENNATVAGVDVNQNGIRDDVERAIFKKYPTDKKSRAAALQYAKALQMEFTQVYNSETLVAVIQEEDRGFICLGEDRKREEIKDLVFDTEVRRNWRENIREQYGKSYKLSNIQECDILF